MVPRENKINAYAKFGRINKEYYGIFQSGIQRRLHFSRVFCGSTRLHGHATSIIVLTQSTLFVFKWKTAVWKMFTFCLCAGFNPVSSQASEGYKLKAECLFLIYLELLFWHIFRSSDKVT